MADTCQLIKKNHHGHDSKRFVCVAHCCTGCGAAGCSVPLVQQDSVDVDVYFSVGVTQVELQHIPSVTIKSTNQGAITAQLLKRSCGISSPGALQETNHNNTLIPKSQWLQQQYDMYKENHSGNDAE